MDKSKMTKGLIVKCKKNYNFSETLQTSLCFKYTARLSSLEVLFQMEKMATSEMAKSQNDNCEQWLHILKISNSLLGMSLVQMRS